MRSRQSQQYLILFTVQINITHILGYTPNNNFFFRIFKTFYFLFIFNYYFFTLQYFIGFAIH